LELICAVVDGVTAVVDDVVVVASDVAVVSVDVVVAVIDAFAVDLVVAFVFAFDDVAAWATWATWATVVVVVATALAVGGVVADPRSGVADAPNPRIIARRSLVKMKFRVETCPPSKLVAPAARVGS
jgi:hypothetical protein